MLSMFGIELYICKYRLCQKNKNLVFQKRDLNSAIVCLYKPLFTSLKAMLSGAMETRKEDFSALPSNSAQTLRLLAAWRQEGPPSTVTALPPPGGFATNTGLQMLGSDQEGRQVSGHVEGTSVVTILNRSGEGKNVRRPGMVTGLKIEMLPDKKQKYYPPMEEAGDSDCMQF